MAASLSEFFAMFLDTPFFLHFILFLVSYSAMHRYTLVLQRPFPWIFGPRSQVNIDGFNSFDHAAMRNHFRSHRFLSKVIKVILLLCVLQAVIIGYLIVNKCRWSTAGQELAKLYEEMDYEFRPILKLPFVFNDILIVLFYFLAVDGAVLFMVYKLYKVYPEGRPGDNMVPVQPIHFTLIPFAILWCALTQQILNYCSHFEDNFIYYLNKLNSI